MNLLLLRPSDVLFFRDGRPMSGGLAGHGAAWPLPSVTNAALHAALHRAELPAVHPHHQKLRKTVVTLGARKFGSLSTAGPFPVRIAKTKPADSVNDWFFPRPADVRRCDGRERLEIAFRPAPLAEQWMPGASSSLPKPLLYAVAACRPPAKEVETTQWLAGHTFKTYLTENFSQELPPNALFRDRDIFEAEHTVGIGIDACTGTQDGERIYSAHYLRLREEWRLAVLAEATEVENQKSPGRDLINDLFRETERIVVGGQQRLCSVERFPANELQLPRGLTTFKTSNGKCRVKWVLLSPAVWPAISDQDRDGKPLFDREGKPIRRHTGGWLPNWIAAEDYINGFSEKIRAGDVLLRSGIVREHLSRKKLSRGTLVRARLAAALVPKPLIVTGYALPGETEGMDENKERSGGPKSIHLAVPAGAVYYFETEGEEAEQQAQDLANTLNWHGPSSENSGARFRNVKHRRSTLLGEKGFGLGVCGTWAFCDEGKTQPAETRKT